MIAESVASQWPAQPDPGTGLTWYRPARDKGMSIEQWGWTSEPNQAHDDYKCFGCFRHPSRCTCNGPAPVTVIACEPNETPHLPECPDCGSRRYDCPHRVPSVPTTTEESVTEVQFVAGGSTPRTTEWSEYPLPPAAPRFTPKFNGYRQYLLPHPDGGLPTGFARATTVAKTLDDTFRLGLWSERTKVASVVKLIDAALSGHGGLIELLSTAAMAASDTDPVRPHNERAVELVEQLLTALAGDKPGPQNDTIDLINNYNGGQDANEFGTAVHAWLEALDLGQIQLWQIPAMFQPWAKAYRDALQRVGMIAVPIYVERLVLDDSGEETIVGTLDRIYFCVTTGELYLGDVKTSKAENLQYSWLAYVVQLNAYARARLMMATDGSGWEPMPKINPDMAVLVHVPSDAPEKSAAIPYRLKTGDKYKTTSITAREHRRMAKHEVPGMTTPVPSPAALRFVAAYQAIQDTRSVDDLNAIWEQYQDVWTDDLTQLGHTVAALFT